MRRVICCLVIIVVIGCQAFAFADNKLPKLNGYRFDLKAVLNADTFPEKYRKVAQGYADLLDCLRFQGELIMSDDSDFDLRLSVVPNDKDDASLRFRIYGSEAVTYITSPLFGRTVMEFQNPALNEFALKIYNHMNIPLHYICCFFPFVRNNAIFPFVEAWNEVIGDGDMTRKIPAEKWKTLAEKWRPIVGWGWYFKQFSTSLGIVTGKENLLEEIFDSIPDVIESSFADGMDVYIDNGKETWTYGNKVFFEKTTTDGSTAWKLTPPPLLNGRVSVSASLDENKTNKGNDIRIRFILTDEEEGALIDFELVGKDIPDRPMTNSEFSIVLHLDGLLLPHIFVKSLCRIAENGEVSLVLDWRPGEQNEKKGILSIKGSVIPFIPEKEHSFDTEEEGMDYCSVFFLNDNRLSELLHAVLKPVIKGMIPFIAEMPVSACQSVMDTLMYSGILDVLAAE